MNKRKELNNPEWWFTYKDLGSDAITIEDFYKPEYMKPIIEDVLRENEIEIPTGDWLSENNKIKEIQDLLGKAGKQGDEIKEIIINIKDRCVKSIKKQDINEDKINEVLSKLVEKMGVSTTTQ